MEGDIVTLYNTMYKIHILQAPTGITRIVDTLSYKISTNLKELKLNSEVVL